MNIAIISSIHKPTTLEAKGGQEIWAAEFILEEIKRGHTFDLYAVKDSINLPGQINLQQILDKSEDEVKLDPFFVKSKQRDKDLSIFASYAYIKILLQIQKKQDTYDLIIDGTGNALIGISWLEFKKPLLIIGHFSVSNRYVNFYKYFNLSPNISFTFPSALQYYSCPWIPEVSKYVVPNGVDISDLAYRETIEKNNMIFISRFDIEMPKGLEESIEVAKRLDLHLDIYTFIEPESQEYYEKNILPTIEQNDKISVTLPPQPTKNSIFNNGKLLLFPTGHEEAFGLVLVEAMATGTPVVAFARGAIPEIIKDGETGFIVNPSDDDIRDDWIIKKTGIEGLCEAVEKIYSMPDEEYKRMRKNCREHVEKNFTIEHMVDQYEEVFKKIMDKYNQE